VEEREDERSSDAWKSLAKIVGFFLVLIGLSFAFRDQLAPLGRAFVDRFGLAGLGLGSFLADGFHFPVPPQFYLATAIAAGDAHALPVAVVMAGSILGGLVAFAGARLAARSGVSAMRFGPVRRVGRLLEKQGAGLVGVATFAPIPYWLLCVSAGLYRLPLRAYAIIGLCRVPKLLFFYVLISLAWCGGQP
jgi:membrane protein YqaA with SNARE-associated domain